MGINRVADWDPVTGAFPSSFIPLISRLCDGQENAEALIHRRRDTEPYEVDAAVYGASVSLGECECECECEGEGQGQGQGGGGGRRSGSGCWVLVM